MTTVRSILRFTLAAVAEIDGAWLIRQGVREHKGLLGICAVETLGRWCPDLT